MIRIALNMLMGDRVKYSGLLLGTSFTAFLVCFAASYFCGIMTRSFALVAENPWADVWVMDRAVVSADLTINIPDGSLERTRSVAGVASAVPIGLANTDARLTDGRFIPVQVIALDNASHLGLPALPSERPAAPSLAPDTVVIDAGGTEGKLVTAAEAAPVNTPGTHPEPPTESTRPLRVGDELWFNDHTVRVAAVSSTLPRFPPRPLVYATYATARRMLPTERMRTTFLLVKASPGVEPRELAARISLATGLRARTGAELRQDTVRWSLANSEDVGDVAAMLAVAACIGLGSTAVLLFLFTAENARHYALLCAMGTGRRTLIAMVAAQSGLCGLLGAGIGTGLCAVMSLIASGGEFPFRMMWPAPLAAGLSVVVACLVAGLLSLRPVLKAHPLTIFNGTR